jgi:bacteriorhodopsin
MKTSNSSTLIPSVSSYFGRAFRLSLAREILTSGRRSAARNSPRVARFFNFLAGYIVVLGSFYPIIWSIPVS